MTPEPSIFTPAMVSAVGGVIVLILGAITHMIVGLRKKADETAVKVDGVLSGLRKDLEVAQTEIVGLKKLNTAVTEAKTDAVQALTAVTEAKAPKP